MIRNDRQHGRPFGHFRNTKAAIEALTGLTGGEEAYATDTGKVGYYDAIVATWIWDSSSGGGNNVTPYRISVSVVSNNLTLSLRDKDGNNPSTSSPVRVQIGDTVREITSALSVTANAGTNWFNAGSSELATREIDYFAYLGYNATDGVVIGFSRIPYARIYSDFSTTTTNERYARISTITNATANDPYIVIGRFAATLSAGAGYTWTVPTFTARNLIHHPIHETRWLTWQPTITGYSTLPSNTVYRYRLVSNTLTLTLREAINGTHDSTTNNPTYTTPFTSANITSYQQFGIAIIINNNANDAVGMLRWIANSSSVTLIRSQFTAWTANQPARCTSGNIFTEI